MTFDLVVVGAGPAGLACAIAAAQRAQEQSIDISIAVVDKAAEIGGHILSGAVIDPRALYELFPDLEQRQPDWGLPVSSDETWLLTKATDSIKIPNFLLPRGMHNQGCRVLSLANLCRWLAEQAEALGVEIFPGFSGARLHWQDERVAGVFTGAMGVGKDGQPKANHQPEMLIAATFTVLAEGARGHLGQQVMAKYSLQGADPQHYGLGIKELWDIPKDLHQPGKVIHCLGWPLSEHGATGGGFIYHQADQQLAIGLITDLNYGHPQLSPFEEFQRFKQHPLLAPLLRHGQQVSYGARAIAKGGWQSLAKMDFPGGLLIGCDAGTLDPARIKGSHTALVSGRLAGEQVVAVLAAQQQTTALSEAFAQSWAGQALYRGRNLGPAVHRFGSVLGGAYGFIEQNIFRGRLPWTLNDGQADHQSLKPLAEVKPLAYSKADGRLHKDRLSSVFLANTNHEEDQPCHLQLLDPKLPSQKHWPIYGEPAVHYCPAAVYELIAPPGQEAQLVINAQNCIHCKTCDIKDPGQNIRWVTPEAGGGPNYPNM